MSSRDWSTARTYGRFMQDLHLLQEATQSDLSQDDILFVLNVNEVQADAQPKKVTVSGLGTVIGGGGGATALSGLSDVDIVTTPPTNGQALVYASGTGEWIPGDAGAAAAGSANEIQYNDGSSGLAASADLTWDDTAKELGVGGDINLDDGGTYSTTVQTVTPTANRTISFPDATGTVALVAGSSGQVAYNNAGSNAGLTSASIGSTGEINISLAGAASTPPVSFTGSWFTGGTSTTTKPQLLIEPTGTTSTAWSTSGTGLGVNAASGFSGNLLDLQSNGTPRFYVKSNGWIHSTDSLYGLTVLASTAGFPIFVGGPTQAYFNSTISLSNNAPANAPDVYITRDAANILAQRNGTNAQTTRLYNTYTDGSNYERGFLKWNSNVFEIGTEGAGTGSEKPVRITAATLKLPNLPTYADNAAATTGGLVAGDVYKTATGELRITV